MIGLIEALNFRCLRYIRQPLGPFHVLVGPNASGKTSFLDILAFLSTLVTEGAQAAVTERTDNFHDLVSGRKQTRFELAIEAPIPDEFQTPRDSPDYDLIRYEVGLALNGRTNEFGIVQESLLLGNAADSVAIRATNGSPRIPQTLFQSPQHHRWKSLIWQGTKHEYSLTPEQPEPGHADGYWIIGKPDKTWPVFRQLDEAEFPASVWLGSVLKTDIARIELSSTALRRPSPPGAGLRMTDDGSSLPWAVAELRGQHPDRFKAWLAHVRIAFPDVKTIRVITRPEDKHRYLIVREQNGLEVPSWMLSDGMLRFLALTLLAYLPGDQMTYLVEEPETSLHPQSIELVLQSLGSVYDGQVLVATQSASVVAATELDKILVFSRDRKWGTRIERGDHHPALRDWKGQPYLDVLFASGVLG
jgi:predicted ATPase